MPDSLLDFRRMLRESNEKLEKRNEFMRRLVEDFEKNDKLDLESLKQVTGLRSAVEKIQELEKKEQRKQGPKKQKQEKQVQKKQKQEKPGPKKQKQEPKKQAEPKPSAAQPALKSKCLNGNKVADVGEYLLKDAYPESYCVLETMEQTLDLLQGSLESQKSVANSIKMVQEQYQERMDLVRDMQSLSVSNLARSLTKEINDHMPMEIHSDKGVAVKVEGVYEIFEYED